MRGMIKMIEEERVETEVTKEYEKVRKEMKEWEIGSDNERRGEEQ